VHHESKALPDPPARLSGKQSNNPVPSNKFQAIVKAETCVKEEISETYLTNAKGLSIGNNIIIEWAFV